MKQGHRFDSFRDVVEGNVEGNTGANEDFCHRGIPSANRHLHDRRLNESPIHTFGIHNVSFLSCLWKQLTAKPVVQVSIVLSINQVSANLVKCKFILSNTLEIDRQSIALLLGDIPVLSVEFGAGGRDSLSNVKFTCFTTDLSSLIFADLTPLCGAPHTNAINRCLVGGRVFLDNRRWFRRKRSHCS